jgi:hypothetical protein
MTRKAAGSGKAYVKISSAYRASRLRNQLPVWAPDAAIRKTIMVDNPARLYGF